jgi:hypothetical protein
MKIVARRLPVATVVALAALAPLLPRAAFAQAAPGQAPATVTAPATGPVRPAADAARNDQTLDAKITELMNVSGGLTAEQVGKRAEETSFDLKARQAEIAAAAAEVDKAMVGYFPRLSLTGSYRRLSPIEIPSLGVLTGPVRSRTRGVRDSSRRASRSRRFRSRFRFCSIRPSPRPFSPYR